MKLTKGELNRLLCETEKDNPDYTLIYKLIYLYAKDARTVLSLRKSDVDFDNKTIKFKDQPFPLLDDFDVRLQELENADGKYFFIQSEDEKQIDIHRKRLTYYITSKIKQLDLPSHIKRTNLSMTDLRRLRGQHLIVDGVDFDVIKKLYLQGEGTTTQFRKYLEYDELKEEMLACSSLDTVFEDYTDFSIFDFDDANPQYVVEDVQGRQFYMNVNEDCVEFLDDAGGELINRVRGYHDEGLLDNLYTLKSSEFKVVGDLRFFRF